jgi:hypothetical protein
MTPPGGDGIVRRGMPRREQPELVSADKGIMSRHAAEDVPDPHRRLREELTPFFLVVTEEAGWVLLSADNQRFPLSPDEARELAAHLLDVAARCSDP